MQAMENNFDSQIDETNEVAEPIVIPYCEPDEEFLDNIGSSSVQSPIPTPSDSTSPISQPNSKKKKRTGKKDDAIDFCPPTIIDGIEFHESSRPDFILQMPIAASMSVSERKQNIFSTVEFFSSDTEFL